MDEKVIENRKKLWEIIKEARRRSKPSKCILCGKEQTSFCNSHSIPQFVLRAIEDNGKFLWMNSIIGEEAIDLEYWMI